MNPTGSLFDIKQSKKEIIKDILTNSVLFKGPRNTDLAFTPIRFIWEDFLLWYLGKRTQIKISAWPETQFSQSPIWSWPHVLIGFNFSDNQETWQSIVIEDKSSIFTEPFNQLWELFNTINKTVITTGYVIQISPITEPKQFWQSIKDKKESDKILSVEFNLNVPNLFWIKDELSQELKDAQSAYNATQTTIEIHNEEWWLTLNKENPFLAQSVSYIERGWWIYKIKLTGNRTITSADSAKSKNIDFDLDITAYDDATLTLILNKIFDD